MPLYEYTCKRCGNFEIMQRMSEEPLKKCPTCGAKVTKLISLSAFHLKGSGWYATDYSKNDPSKSKAEDTKSKAGDAKSKAEDTKPATSEVKDSSAASTSTAASSSPKESAAKESTSTT